MFLAQNAKRVHMLVRTAGLTETMSRYLIRRIEQNPVIVLRPKTEITALEGGNHLERVSWGDNETGVVTAHDVRHVFSMTGAVPATTWLAGCVTLDREGFIKTGPDLSPEDLSAANWPVARPPHLLETSLPGVSRWRRSPRQRQTRRVGRGRRLDRDHVLVHQALSE